MSREIKFQLVRKADNKIVCCYQEGVQMTPDTGELYQGSMNVTDRYILRQYIGRHDDKKSEIFAGDIVKVWHEDYPEEPVTGKVWQFDCYYPAFDIYVPSDRSATGFESYSDEFNSFSCP